jgi:hypothetical protein
VSRGQVILTTVLVALVALSVVIVVLGLAMLTSPIP